MLCASSVMFKVFLIAGTAASACWEPRWRWSDALLKSEIDQSEVEQIESEAISAERAATPECSSYANCVDKMNEVFNLWERLYSVKLRLDKKYLGVFTWRRKQFDKAGEIMATLLDLKQEYLSNADDFRRKLWRMTIQDYEKSLS